MKKSHKSTASPDFLRLPSSQRTPAAENKYSEALQLYATSDLTIRQVSEICKVTPAGLSSFISKHHRPLLYARYGYDINPSGADIKVKSPKGQSERTHIKYKDAIQACGDMAYIEYNISQIARMFGHSPSALAAQLRVHYPDIIPSREETRQRLGIADNARRGPRAASEQLYKQAADLYGNSDLTVAQVAEKFDISLSGFKQFMRFYRKDILASKASRRAAADPSSPVIGSLAANGTLYGPKDNTVGQYAQALELYRNTGLTVDNIIDATGVPSQGFKGYLNRWHPRRALSPTAAKYAAAIQDIRDNAGQPLAQIATRHGLNPDTFRQYLKKHYPDLIARLGMTTLPNGKLVKAQTYLRYRDAINQYATSPQPLNAIARQHGIPYKSIHRFMLKNCSDVKQKHDELVRNTSLPA